MSFLQSAFKLSDSLLRPLPGNIQVQLPAVRPLLYHGAEGGDAVWGHGSGGVAICWRVRPHQEGAAIYGVLPLLRRRPRVWHGTRGVGDIGLEPVSHRIHLARHHGNPAVS